MKKKKVIVWIRLFVGVRPDSSTTKYYSSTTKYYSVLRSTTPVLQSTTPVLQRTTKYYSRTTKYYTTKGGHKVPANYSLLQYYLKVTSDTRLINRLVETSCWTPTSTETYKKKKRSNIAKEMQIIERIPAHTNEFDHLHNCDDFYMSCADTGPAWAQLKGTTSLKAARLTATTQYQ